MHPSGCLLKVRWMRTFRARAVLLVRDCVTAPSCHPTFQSAIKELLESGERSRLRVDQKQTPSCTGPWFSQWSETRGVNTLFTDQMGHSCMVLSVGVVPNVPNASRIIGPAGKTTAPALLIRRERK